VETVPTCNIGCINLGSESDFVRWPESSLTPVVTRSGAISYTETTSTMVLSLLRSQVRE